MAAAKKLKAKEGFYSISEKKNYKKGDVYTGKKAEELKELGKIG